MPHESSQLTADEWADLEDRADRFHAALRAGPVADWEPFLGDLPLRLRASVLAELAILDLGHRYGKGESPLVEEYVRRFPELGPADRVPQKLLLEERRCRQKFGPAPTPGEYRNRFPIQAAALGAELDPPTVPDSLVQASTMPSHHMMTMVHEGAEEEEKPAVQHSAIEIDAPDPEHQEKSGPSSSVMSMNSRYELVRVLGSGAFADVWLARKAPSGIEVAVKIVKQAIDKNAAQRELGSLELIKNLRHPYLLATLDYWVSKSKLHIVMELAEGTLRSRMKECAKEGLPGVPREEILPLFAEAAEGLDFLHSKSITHRDVKPDNILILNGHTKVADFGLARQQDEIMASMSFAGTPIYMSPEGWSGKGGPASDQYSLAFAYIEVRQGYCPIKPGPFADVMFAHIEGKFEFADFLEPKEIEVLRKALAREPELRYPSCAAFIEALADACGASYVIRRSRKHGSSTAIGTAAAVRTPPTGTPSRPAGNLMETLIPEKTLGDRSHPVKPPAGPKAPAPAEASAQTVDEWMTTSTVGKPDVAPAKSKAPLLLILAGLALVVGGGGLAVMMLSGGGTGTAVVPTDHARHHPEHDPAAADRQAEARGEELAPPRGEAGTGGEDRVARGRARPVRPHRLPGRGPRAPAAVRADRRHRRGVLPRRAVLHARHEGLGRALRRVRAEARQGDARRRPVPAGDRRHRRGRRRLREGRLRRGVAVRGRVGPRRGTVQPR